MTTLTDNKLIVVVTALICGTTIEAIALMNGINGTMLTVYFGIVTATIGYSFGVFGKPKNG